MMPDNEKSFTFLQANIPSWLQDVAGIEEKLSQMHDEISKAPLFRSVPMKRRTGSIESIRDWDATSTSGALQQTHTVTRKRKAPSTLSDHASGPLNFIRSRHMTIVHYDGQIQKGFEAVVRNIGMGRNMLRKGKMTARMEALAELAGSDDDSEEDDPVASTIGYRHRTGLSSMQTRAMRSKEGNNSKGTPCELFDTTDKALELAQALCERAAHQSLRDGDCRKELEGIKKQFQDVLDVAAKEVERYKTWREEEQQRAARDEAKVDSVLSTPASPLAPTTVEPKPSFSIIPPTGPTTTMLNGHQAVDIEIDDESDDEMDFVMPPIRLTSRI
jgi:hypothetical protein